MKVKVYAKLNLSLNVLGAQNGFHLIDSVVTSVDVYDTVEVTKRDDERIVVKGMDGISVHDNTAYRAALAFRREFGVCGVNVYVSKGIPVGAGMGGSSADIAAVVYCMCKICGIDLKDARVLKLCSALGSDVGFMLFGGFARLRGKGDDVEFITADLPAYFAVTTFSRANSTADIYARYDNVGSECVTDNDALVRKLIAGETDALTLNNGLERASVSMSDYASKYLFFNRLNGKYPNMTGSGSAYYVMFGSKAGAAEWAYELNGQGYETFVCRSVDKGIEEI